MSTETPTPADIAPKTPEATSEGGDPKPQQPETDSVSADGADADAKDLRDEGKKAIDRMKAERNAARAELKAAQDERDRLKAAAEGKEAEWEAEKKAREDADKRFNERILKAELKAAATGKLANPAVAEKFIDLTKFEVGADGSFDSDALVSAIDDLISKEPYLAAQGSRFTGTPDAGTRKEAGKSQLSQSDISSMSSAEVNQARREGRLNDLLNIN